MSIAASSSASASSESSNVVHPGGCYLQNELLRCALDEAHCNGLEFRSSRQMRESDDEEVGRCQRPHPDFVGMCTSEIDSFHCTGHPSGCVIWSMFVPNISYCSLQYNHFPGRDIHLALYGTCSDSSKGSNACVWSLDDCPGAGTDSDITYTPATFAPTSNVDSLCTCDKVRTGACAFGEDWTCAVSAGACDKESDFRTREQVLEAGRDCRLCPLFDKNSPEAISTENLWWSGRRSSNDNHQHDNHQHDNHRHDNHRHDNLQDETCPGGIVAGAMAGVLVAVGGALAIDYFCRRRSGGNGGNRSTVQQSQADHSTEVPEEASPDEGELTATKTGTLA